MDRGNEVSAKVNAFLFIPNILEYIRISLLFLMFFYMQNPPIFTILYFVCAHIDCIDGYVARRLNQESNLGRVLDYTIDRITIAMLSAVLIALYPNFWPFFTLVMLLDMASHLCQIYSTLFLKFDNHKLISKYQGRVMNLYYSKRLVMYYAGFSQDLWLGSFYLYHFYPENTAVIALMIALFPGFILKATVNIMQIYTSLRLIS